MKKLSRMIPILTINFIFITISFSQALTGKIIRVKGTVLLFEGRKRPVKATTGSRVNGGTIIKTGIRSGATLIIGSSITRVGQLSRVRVSLMERKTRGKFTRIRLQLRRGRLRSLVKKIKGSRVSFKVRTPVSVASVRGTELEVSHGPSFGTVVRFLSGNGLLADMARRQRPVKKGQESRVQENRAPTTLSWEDKMDSRVPVAPYNLVFPEVTSIFNVDEIIFESPQDDPIENFNRFTKESKKTTVKTIISFP